MPQRPGPNPREALSSLDRGLVRVFQYDAEAGNWRIFDPRPEMGDANTLENLTPGESYWVGVIGEDGIIRNGQVRNLVDGWNVLVW